LTWNIPVRTMGGGGWGWGSPPPADSTMAIYERLREEVNDAKREKKAAKVHKASRQRILPGWQRYRQAARARAAYWRTDEAKEVERKWREMRNAEKNAMDRSVD